MSRLSPAGLAANRAAAQRRMRDPEERFREKYCISASGCWVWTAAKYSNGYGHFGLAPRKGVIAHRFSYELNKGAIPEGLDLDHLCRNRACVNPDHLEPCTRRENTLRSPIAIPAINARKSLCSAGHEYNAENTRLRKNGQRRCRTCDRAREQMRKRTRRALHANQPAGGLA